ncbi:hypothetical protein BV25DRAFT_817076 [Artomyces pyxidatus]|uniref:Uncharacterized protein n=1 Tax=Artomyces pyxidatus TaxID=48021 RepID=A0ACB8SWK1_9AGAM|nr:hypothetical protein BV25DRAFT_817076 [Artomyces pyxidatus]
MSGLPAGNCSHVFCIECLRSWRDRDGKSEDVIESGVHKKCPYCRTPSKFITPSSVFFPERHPGKAATIERYKASLARISCKYFTKSKPDDPFCPFGKDCLYRHERTDGTPHTFKHGTDYYMPLWRHRYRLDQSPEAGTQHPDAWSIEGLAIASSSAANFIFERITGTSRVCIYVTLLCTLTKY